MKTDEDGHEWKDVDNVSRLPWINWRVQHLSTWHHVQFNTRTMMSDKDCRHVLIIIPTLATRSPKVQCSPDISRRCDRKTSLHHHYVIDSVICSQAALGHMPENESERSRKHQLLKGAIETDGRDAPIITLCNTWHITGCNEHNTKDIHPVRHAAAENS